MYFTIDELDSVKDFPTIHDALYCISKWDSTKSIHSIYVDPSGEAALTFNSILDEDSIKLVLAQFMDKNWGEESYKDIKLEYEKTHRFEFEDGKTYVFTPDGIDLTLDRIFED